ncbi:MAG: hypothetical protein AAFY84_01355 [Pseudomonadota bacterium]
MGRSLYKSIAKEHLRGDHPDTAEKSADVDLAEYSALKEEQIGRIALRDGALHVNIVVSLSLFAFGVSEEQNRIIPLLLVPYSSLILFWIFYTNDTYVSRIRHYVEEVTRPALKAKLQLPDPLAWEAVHRRVSLGRVFRKTLTAVVLLLSFVGPASLSLLVASDLPLDFLTSGIQIGGHVCLIICALGILVRTFD